MSFDLLLFLFCLVDSIDTLLVHILIDIEDSGNFISAVAIRLDVHWLRLFSFILIYNSIPCFNNPPFPSPVPTKYSPSSEQNISLHTKVTDN